METEVENKIPFLDCLIHKRNEMFEVEVYRKKTFTGLGTSFFSFSPSIYKLNSIKTLIYRAYKISSSMTSLCKEWSFLAKLFKKNGFPTSVFFSQVRKFIYNLQNRTEKPATVEKKQIYCVLPYFGPGSDELKSNLRMIIGRHFPFINLNVCFVNRNTIGSLFRFKEVLPMELTSSVVYKYCCSRCGSGCYVGSTIRPLYMRISEHAGLSYRTNKQLSNPEKSAILEHSKSCNSMVKVEDFKILGGEKFSLHLRMFETMHINSHRPNLNDKNSALDYW